MSKRVPSQYHLTSYTQSTYKELPLLNLEDGFVGEYLERLRCTLFRVVERYSKVFAVRVDLRFPNSYLPGGQEILSNVFLHSFIKQLRNNLRRYKVEKQQLGLRVHSMDFEYVWAREYGPHSNKPHFHLILLFNGHAFNSLGHFSSDHESLFNRIGEAWGAALGIHVGEGSKLVHFPDDGQYLVSSRDWGQVGQVFCRASYLAKVRTKNFRDGFHPFGGSRS